MNCDTAIAEIRKSAGIPDAVLDPDVVDHLDDCGACSMALLDGISVGIANGTLAAPPMPPRLRKLASGGQQGGFAASDVPANNIPDPVSGHDHLTLWTKFTTWWNSMTARPVVWALASTCAAAGLLVALMVVSSDRKRAHHQLAAARQEVREQSARRQAAENTAADMQLQRAHVTVLAQTATRERDEMALRLQRLNGHGAGVQVAIGHNLYRDGQGNVTYGRPISVAPVDSGSVVAALSTGRLAMPSRIAELKQESESESALLGPNDERKPLASAVGPVNTLVLDARPVFRWRPLRSGRYYRLSLQTESRDAVATIMMDTKLSGTCEVQVYGKESSSQPVEKIKIPAGEEHTLMLSSKLPPLEAGQTYRWFVEEQDAPARDAAPSANASKTAYFQVADKAAETDARRAQSQYAASHLLLGAYYAGHGFLDDARNELAREPDKKAAETILKKLPNP